MTSITLRHLGLRDYEPIWQEMQAFTRARNSDTTDELWLVEHPPVFTLGLNGKPAHLHDPGTIPVVQTDRGGQVTYHGPGQVVLYAMLDLRRRGLGVKEYVNRMEQAVINLLAEHAIHGERNSGAPGVYVGGAKIAALGLRVTRGGCYHGIALNVDMDLAPYACINPCGYPGMQVTQLADFTPGPDLRVIGKSLADHLQRVLQDSGKA